MFATAKVKQEPLDEASPPAQTLTDAERTALQLQECSSDKCNEELCKLQEEALAEGVTVPAGWHCSRHLRLTGSLKGKAYTLYHDSHNSVLRSKASARKRLGLTDKRNRKAVKSSRNSTDFAKAKVPEQTPKQTKQGEAVKANNSMYRMLEDLTDADLPANLLQVHITCVETGSGVAKAGLWYPCSNRVECHAQCCAGKTVEERTMRCGGLHSFETHCGKNPKQNHWKQTFKVNEEGYEGLSVEKYMSIHGIKLTKPKRSRSSLQHRKNSAPLLSAQCLHARTSPEPAKAKQASASLAHQQSSPQSPCPDCSEGEQHEENAQQQNAEALLASAARVSTDRQQCSHTVPAANPSIGYDDDEELHTVDEPIVAQIFNEPLDGIDPDDRELPTSHETMEDVQPSHVQQEDASDDEMVYSEAEDHAEPHEKSSEFQQDGDRVGSAQGAGKVESAAVARLKQKQAKLNWNHGNKMRTLRRQLQKKEAEVQALQLEFAKTKTNTAPIELDSAGQQAAFVSKEGKSHVEGDAPGPSNQGAKECACCKEKDDCVAKLEKELANAKAQCQQRKGVEQRASAEYADLMEEHKKLKIRVYDLRVSGC